MFYQSVWFFSCIFLDMTLGDGEGEFSEVGPIDGETCEKTGPKIKQIHQHIYSGRTKTLGSIG